MSRKHHKLKLETKFYQEYESGKKRFEIRKNDRDYYIGDYVRFVEVVDGVKTGRISEQFEIINKLEDYKGIERGFCILQLKGPYDIMWIGSM